jgi:hypothetical protein
LSAFVSIMQTVFMDYWALGKPLKEKIRFIAQRKRAELLAQRMKERFEEEGWTADAPGMAEGISSKIYTFDVGAKGPPNSQLFIDIVLNEPVYEKIIEKSNVVSDISPHSYLIASKMPFGTDELRLAELYRIKIVHSDTDEALISSVLSTIIK